jgi:hypothetical protein
MRTLLLLSLLVLTTAVYSTTYYVSPSGNDSNNGTSEKTPWRTLKNVNSRNFKPGDYILFERGGVWNERLNITSSGSPSGQITYSAYGDPDKKKPVFDGIMEVEGWTNPSNWTNMGNNVWRINTWGTVYGRVWIDGVEKERSRYGKEGEGITAEYPWQKINNRLYVYSQDNPSRTFTSIEMTNQQNFLSSTEKDFISISYFEMRGWHVLEFNGFSNLIIEHCDITVSGFRGIDIKRNGSRLTRNGTIRYCTFDTKYPFYEIRIRGKDTGSWVYMGTEFALRLPDGGQINWDIHNNSFKGWGYTVFWFTNHRENGFMTEGVRFYNNKVDGSGLNYGRAIAGHQYIAQVNESYPIEIFNNIFYMQAVPSQVGTPYLKIYNNVFNGATGLNGDGSSITANALELFGYTGRQSYKNKIYNNIFAYCGYAGMFLPLSASHDPVVDLELVNNIFFENGAGKNWQQLRISYWPTSAALINPRIENNLFWSNTTSNVVYSLSSGMTVAAFDALDGKNDQQLNPKDNIQANPLFIDPRNGDFRLGENSPAIGAGLPPLSDVDHNGTPWQIPYSIGPFEPHSNSSDAFVITLATEGEGSIDVFPELDFYPTGTIVQLSAKPGENWEFAGWEGDIHSNNSEISLVIDDNINILAQFSTVISDSEIHETREVSIYPNPAKDHFIISMEEPILANDAGSFRITDMSGMTVYRDILTAGKTIIQIPGQLKTGVYIIEILMRGIPFHSQRLLIRN